MNFADDVFPSPSFGGQEDHSMPAIAYRSIRDHISVSKELWMSDIYVFPLWNASYFDLLSLKVTEGVRRLNVQ